MTSTPTSSISSASAQVSPHLSRAYWSTIPATVPGMLGGYPQVSRVDLKGSYLFFQKLQKLYPSSQKAPSLVDSSESAAGGTGCEDRESKGMLALGLELGAGIGRITSGLLSRICIATDIVEPQAQFASQAPLQEMAGLGRVGEVFVVGMEEWVPRPGRKYDIVWAQWCLGYLDDRELVRCLSRFSGRGNEVNGREGGCLREGGWVIVKENMSTTMGEGETAKELELVDVYDELDSSVTRSDASYRKCFQEAGLKVVKSELQKGFERGLLPVRFYALRVDEG
ncbi:MAG: hypothetical protein Q9195_003073 [Heterodermia aff. obscurata]